MTVTDRLTEGPTVTVGLRRYTTADIDQLLNDTITAAQRLRDGHTPRTTDEPLVISAAELMRRDTQPVGGDGYPAGGPTERSSSDVADPTPNAALHRVEHDRVHAHLEACIIHIVEARNTIVAAVSRSYAVGQWQDSQRGRRRTIDTCVHCGEDCLPRAKAGRCLRCYEYRRTHNGTDRPLPPAEGLGAA